MRKPPKTLDGARVLAYALIDPPIVPTGATRHRRGAEELGPFRALAICQHPGDTGCYLFYCNDQWEVETDTWHENLSRAKDQAEFEYEGVSGLWIESFDDAGV